MMAEAEAALKAAEAAQRIRRSCSTAAASPSRRRGGLGMFVSLVALYIPAPLSCEGGVQGVQLMLCSLFWMDAASLQQSASASW